MPLPYEITEVVRYMRECYDAAKEGRDTSGVFDINILEKAERCIAQHDAPTDFRIRVLTERDDLAHKIAKLNAYIVSPAFFDQVTDQNERNCLSAQASVMQSYVNVLNARIALWRQRGDIA